MRQAAMQFEAMLLMQLTSALNVSIEDDEESLFGSDSGTGLARQMFSEQMATAMAQAGGIGLAETIMQQFQANQPTKLDTNITGIPKPRAFSTANIIREAKSKSVENPIENSNPIETPINNTVESLKVENNSLPMPSVSAPLYSSSSVSAPTPSSTVGAPSPLFSSKARLSASEINQYVAEAARMSGKPENNIVAEKVTTKVAKPKAQNNSNEMVILSEASEEDIEASKNYDYNTINDRYLTQVYKQSGLIDKTNTRPTTEKTVSDKLPATNPTLNPVNTQNTAAPVNSVKSEENLETKVSLDWPLRGAVRSNFGTRKDPINGKHKFHQGVDIAAKRGTPIAAAADGVVVFAGWGKKYGNNVVIEHADGRRTRYAHADKLFVTQGEMVTKGQDIAAVGSTGRATGPHLHFEVIENGERINPIKALANGIKSTRR